MKTMRIAAIACLLTALAVAALAQDKQGVVSAATTKFGPLEGLPACLTLSPQRGDPTKHATSATQAAGDFQRCGDREDGEQGWH